MSESEKVEADDRIEQVYIITNGRVHMVCACLICIFLSSDAPINACVCVCVWANEHFMQ